MKIDQKIKLIEEIFGEKKKKVTEYFERHKNIKHPKAIGDRHAEIVTDSFLKILMETHFEVYVDSFIKGFMSKKGLAELDCIFSTENHSGPGGNISCELELDPIVSIIETTLRIDDKKREEDYGKIEKFKTFAKKRFISKATKDGRNIVMPFESIDPRQFIQTMIKVFRNELPQHHLQQIALNTVVPLIGRICVGKPEDYEDQISYFFNRASKDLTTAPDFWMMPDLLIMKMTGSFERYVAANSEGSSVAALYGISNKNCHYQLLESILHFYCQRMAARHGEEWEYNLDYLGLMPALWRVKKDNEVFLKYAPLNSTISADDLIKFVLEFDGEKFPIKE